MLNSEKKITSNIFFVAGLVITEIVGLFIQHKSQEPVSYC